VQEIAVMIVDKQALFRAGVCHCLSQADFEVEVFDSAPHQNLMTLIEANLPHVLLLDIDYPSLRGLVPGTENCHTLSHCQDNNANFQS